MKTPSRKWLVAIAIGASLLHSPRLAAQDWWKPYSPPCVEREDVFEFTEKPVVKLVGKDRYEITFAVKGYCDVTVAIVDPDPAKELVKGRGIVVRHLASGVLGPNAPSPFQKNSLRQTLYWNGKDDLDEYVKEPGKLQVRVMLGLRPVFDKLLGGRDARNVPGVVIGLAVGEDGAYVFSKGSGAHDHTHLRKFDHDGNYLQSLAPPPAGLPWEKLSGCGYVEYEPGRRALHAPKVLETLAGDGFWLVGLNGMDVSDLQPALAGGRLYYLNGGSGYFQGRQPSALHYVMTDGGLDVPGQRGRTFLTWPNASHTNARLAASPDGKWLYMCNPGLNVVLRCPAQGDEKAEPFIGGGKSQDKGPARNQPGSSNEHFNNPVGLDCDASGRIYVSDCYNNRVQVFSPEGQHLKTIPIDRPNILRVHQKTGAIYLFHYATVQGRTVSRLSKLTSFENPRVEFYVDNLPAGMMALDSWTPKPRLWIGGQARETYGSSFEGIYHVRGPNVTIWEEEAGTLKKILDFDEAARRADGDNIVGPWSSSVFDHVNCDPTREQLYWRGFRNSPWVFDLISGKKLKRLQLHSAINDISFDKKGYMHLHLDPGFAQPGVVRLDPRRESEYVDYLNRKHPGTVVYREVPYDYGVELTAKNQPSWAGGLPVKDQPGAKYFQDGFGVNMRGDVAVQTNIYFVPRMDDETIGVAFAGMRARVAAGGATWRDGDPYQAYLRSIQEKQRLGEEVYYLPRRPGTPISGGTIWTYDRTGELRDANAVLAGGTFAGAQIDEDGFLYFANSRTKLYDGKIFLHGRKGHLGSDQPIRPNDRSPFTASYFKAKPNGVKFLLRNAIVPLDPPPERPTELVSGGPFGDPGYGDGEAWTEGVEWIYAGASPVIASGCTCASMRPHLDWFKRSYVPEAYRHSIGVLDTNGNLVLHIGRYGNHDDALAMKPGSEDVRLFLVRFISGTDNYLAFDDWGERLVVLKLDYHAEEMARIQLEGGSR